MAGPSGPEIAYGRLKADPAIGVSDISRSIQDYFKKNNGSRNLGQLIENIDKSGIGWKTAPQACVFFFVGWRGEGHGCLNIMSLICLLSIVLYLSSVLYVLVSSIEYCNIFDVFCCLVFCPCLLFSCLLVFCFGLLSLSSCMYMLQVVLCSPDLSSVVILFLSFDSSYFLDLWNAIILFNFIHPGIHHGPVRRFL